MKSLIKSIKKELEKDGPQIFISREVAALVDYYEANENLRRKKKLIGPDFLDKLREAKTRFQNAKTLSES